MKWLAPLDGVLNIVRPTREERILQHARRLDVALDQGNTDEAIHYFNRMQRLYHELRYTRQG